MKLKSVLVTLLTAAFLLPLAAEEQTNYIHYRLGVKYKREGKLEQAVEEFRKVLATYPDNFNAYMHLAEIRAAEGRWRLVIYNLKKALAYNPGWGKAHKGLADAYEQDGQLQKSIMELQLYQQVCDPEERDQVQARIDTLIEKVTGRKISRPVPAPIADSLEESRREAEVQKQAGERAARLASQKRESERQSASDESFQQGVLLYSKGEFEQSLAMLRKAISLEPGHPGAYYYAGLIRRRQGQNEMAITNFQNSLSYTDLGFNAHFYLGKIYGEQEKYPQGIEHLKKYMLSTDYEAGKEEARALIEKYETAIRNAQKPEPVDVRSVVRQDLEKEMALVAPETPEAMLEVRIDSLLTMVLPDTLTDYGQAMLAGVREFEKGHFDAAVTRFKESQARYPNKTLTIYSLYNIGLCYLKMGLYSEADQQFSQLTGKFGTHALAPKAHFMKALANLEMKNTEKAEVMYRDFIRQNRSHEWAGKAYEFLGDAYTELEQHKRAVDAYTQAASLGKSPVDVVNAHFKAGKALLEVGNAKRALTSFKEAIAAGEKADVYQRVPDSYYRVADEYYKSDNLKSALEYYRKATRKYPGYQETAWGLFQIGNVYKKSRDYPKAIAAYKEVIQKYPDDYWARNAEWKMEDTIWENEYKSVMQ